MMWAIILLPLALMLVVSYAITSRQFGAETAMKRLPVFLILMVFIFVAVLAISPFLAELVAEWIDYAFAGVFLLCASLFWLLLVRYIKRAAQAGDLLLEIGPRRDRLINPVAPAMLIGGGLLFASISIAQKLDSTLAGTGRLIVLLSGAVYLVSAGVYLHVAGFNRSSIRSNGIMVSGDFIRWGKIERFQWHKGTRSILVLNVERLLPWWSMVFVPVPPEKRGAVRDILERHLTVRSEGADNAG